MGIIHFGWIIFFSTGHVLYLAPASLFSYFKVIGTWVFLYMFSMCVAFFQLFYAPLLERKRLERLKPLKHCHPVIYSPLIVVCIESLISLLGFLFCSKWIQTRVKYPHGGDIAQPIGVICNWAGLKKEIVLLSLLLIPSKVVLSYSSAANQISHTLIMINVCLSLCESQVFEKG